MPSALYTIRWFLFATAIQAIKTLPIHPTAHLLAEEEPSHRNLNSIYGSFSLIHPKNEHLQKFQKTRHLSRYEHRRQQNTTLEYQIAPLFQGIGTHYATAWVGTPPQRKSVIVDTGSHYTAFPCVGCKDCGEKYHTDKYYDPKKSSTYYELNCGECKATTCKNNKCVFSQSYTEGSSWFAIQVRDEMFLGSNDPNGGSDPIGSTQFKIPFMFGCQTHETGLFVTQLADGIMGMSADEATFHKQLFNQKKVEHNKFSMCFAMKLTWSKEGVNSGFMTMGGTDTALHATPMVYAKNVANTGWYTVQIKNIFLRRGGGNSAAYEPRAEHVKLNLSFNQVNSGKGVIVDSGTTDTYLSRTIKQEFMTKFKEMTGTTYSNNAVKLTEEQVRELPTVLIQLAAWDNNDASGGSLLAGDLDPDHRNDIMIAIPATHYMEYEEGSKSYTSRLYFSEGSGGVLGANSMHGHEILFDWEQHRVGFAQSTCDYAEKYEFIAPKLPTPPSEPLPGNEPCVLSTPSITSSVESSIPLAKCQNKQHWYMLYGTEKYVAKVDSAAKGGGTSCENTGKNLSFDDLGHKSKGKQILSVSCHGDVCDFVVSCDTICGDVMDFYDKQPKEQPEQPKTTDQVVDTSTTQTQQEQPKEEPQPIQDTPTTDQQQPQQPPDATPPQAPPSTDTTPQICAESEWTQCSSTCSQSKTISYLSPDNQCLPSADSVTRPCHIQDCITPCRVPYRVHVTFGLANVPLSKWNAELKEIFTRALAEIVKHEGNTQEILTPGDVHVLDTLVWVDEATSISGVQVITEISIYNPLSDDKTASEEAKCEKTHLDTYVTPATAIQTQLSRESFMADLTRRVDEMLSTAAPTDQSSSTFRFPVETSNVSKVLESSIIATTAAVGVVEATPVSAVVQTTPTQVQESTIDLPFIAGLLSVFLLVLSLGFYALYKMEERRDFAAFQINARSTYSPVPHAESSDVDRSEEGEEQSEGSIIFEKDEDDSSLHGIELT